MKSYSSFIILIFLTSFGFSQDSAKMQAIDSLVALNEGAVTTVFSKLEKNRIESTHGKNPEKVLNVYSFADKNVLISTTYASYSIGDTDIVISLYFNSNKLIKVKTAYFDINSKRIDFNYYYENDVLINKESEHSGIHRSDYYVERANRLQRILKKRLINFPE